MEEQCVWPSRPLHTPAVLRVPTHLAMTRHTSAGASCEMTPPSHLHPHFQAHACAATVNFAEGVEEEILPPYLDTLITKLLTLLQVSYGRGISVGERSWFMCEHSYCITLAQGGSPISEWCIHTSKAPARTSSGTRTFRPPRSYLPHNHPCHTPAEWQEARAGGCADRDGVHGRLLKGAPRGEWRIRASGG